MHMKWDIIVLSANTHSQHCLQINQSSAKHRKVNPYI